MASHVAPAGSAVTPLHVHRASARAEVRRHAMRRAEVKRRRRDVLVTLVGAAGATFALALALGGLVWALHLAVDVALVLYVAVLVQLAQRGAERETKVRYLPARSPRPEPALLLRRSGS
jgi:hypothetical protein